MISRVNDTVPLLSKIFIPDIPKKVYSDILLEFETIKIDIDEPSHECLLAASSSIQLCIPIVKSISPPLPWYDSVSYWMHGCAAIHINSIYISKTYLDRRIRAVKIFGTAKSIRLVLRRNELEASGSDLCVDVDAECDLNVILSKNASGSISAGSSISSSSTLSWKSSESNTGGGDTSSLSSKLIRIPGLVVNVIQQIDSTEDVRDVVHNHHDVYLRPHDFVALREDSKDKFYFFRSMPNTFRLLLRIQCADKPGDPVAIWTRLDVLQRILETLAYASSQSKDENTSHDESITHRGSISDTRAKRALHRTKHRGTSSSTGFERKSSIDSNYNSPAKTPIDKHGSADKVPDKDNIDSPKSNIMDMLCEFDLQIHIEQFLASTWSSSHELHGIVVTQRRFDLQLKMLRKDNCLEDDHTEISVGSAVEKEKLSSDMKTVILPPLVIDHLSAEVLG